MDEKFQNNRKKFINILNDIHANNKKGIDIAKEYNVTTSYISQLKTKLSQVEYELVVKDGSLTCSKCKEDNRLEFHHDHTTGELVALVCRPCNKKIGKNHWQYQSETKYDHISFKYDKIRSFNKLLNMIDEGFLVVDPKKIKNREDDIKWLESLT